MKVLEISQHVESQRPLTVRATPIAVPAGFPSPAQDYFDGTLNLTEHLVRDAGATFYVKVSGDSMQRAGIFDGDQLVVDRSIQAEDGSVVVAVIDGEITVKRLKVTGTGPVLVAENPDYPDLPIEEHAEFTIWGVVTASIHRHL